MREDSVHLNHGLPVPLTEPQTTGFTAVNGDERAIASFRPAEAARPPVTSAEDDPRDNIVVATQVHSHAWRPATRDPSERRDDIQRQDTPTSDKRKRTNDDDELNDSNVGDGQPSPKRREVSTHVDSAIDLVSPDTPLDRRQAEPTPDSRERTPVPQNAPPPQARPETVTTLKSSLDGWLQQHGSQPQQAATLPATTDRASPDKDSDDQAESPDQAQDDQAQRDNSDSKKGKRRFANRTKTGCHTCRCRKKKCDEGRPICQNCIKGEFVCGGYGPKDPNFKVQSTHRQAQVPLQPSAKTQYPPRPPPSYGHPGPWTNPPDDYRGYPQWNRMPEPPRQYEPRADAGYPRGDGWAGPSWAPPPPAPPEQPQYPPPPGYYPPRPDSSHVQPRPYQTPHQLQPPVQLPPPPTPPFPPPPPTEPYATHSNGVPYQIAPHGPPHTITPSRNYSTTSSHHYSSLGHGILGTSERTEKEKMLRGEPYLHFTDSELIGEREQCSDAVFFCNHAADPYKRAPPYNYPPPPHYNHSTPSMYAPDPSKHVAEHSKQHAQPYKQGTDFYSRPSSSERQGLFDAIFEPKQRRTRLAPNSDDRINQPTYSYGPTGEHGDNVSVESPFSCDYGYHLHLGREVCIMAGCYMQDGGGIFIGDRVIVGPNVQILTMSTSVDVNLRYDFRADSQGRGKFYVKAGSVRIGDDVVIGAGATILPYVTIGKGSVIGAGAVVTKDVDAETVVAGNPAKKVRRINKNPDNHESKGLQEMEERAVKKMVEYINNLPARRGEPRLEQIERPTLMRV